MPWIVLPDTDWDPDWAARLPPLDAPPRRIMTPAQIARRKRRRLARAAREAAESRHCNGGCQCRVLRKAAAEAVWAARAA